MLSRISSWSNVTLATAGPIFLGVLGARMQTVLGASMAHAIGLCAMALIVLRVYAVAIRQEGYTLRRMGFQALSLRTLFMAAGLVLFFIFVFGPIAYWALAAAGAESFERGLTAAKTLPAPYLVVTILLVAPAEEALYRGYAIERLADLTGSFKFAGIISTMTFALAHVPMWGWGPASTTIVSGGVMAIAYLWRRDIFALMLAHVASDLCGIVLA